MKTTRSAGVLLHLSSLPGPNGVGDLGPEARRFVEFLAKARQRTWQILPLGPNDEGNPYVAQSSFAGSPFLISLDDLAAKGDIAEDELAGCRVPPSNRVDFHRLAQNRRPLFEAAAGRFFSNATQERREAFAAFCQEQSFWLDDWALFAALKKDQNNKPWWQWPSDIALRTEQGLVYWRQHLAWPIRVEQYIQFVFYTQFAALRALATAHSVLLMGDVPIYCARDSADVWANREVFLLDEAGNPTAVSGVPPDYFAKDGQLWGTPLYDWDACAKTDYTWWLTRLRGVLSLVDVVRIDHFRAFEAYWSVPAGEKTARGGRWIKGPGDDFFRAVERHLGACPFIAEDLGIITDRVRQLRDRWNLPGMAVLHFAFADNAKSLHLPIHHVKNSVVYTGTHDNDTTVGWYEKATTQEKDLFRRYTASDGSWCHYHMIRLAYASVADLAVVPMQDLLGLGSEARMNVPGTVTGNWCWKLLPHQVNDEGARLLADLAEVFDRFPKTQTDAEELQERNDEQEY